MSPPLHDLERLRTTMVDFIVLLAGLSGFAWDSKLLLFPADMIFPTQNLKPTGQLKWEHRNSDQLADTRKLFMLWPTGRHTSS